MTTPNEATKNLSNRLAEGIGLTMQSQGCRRFVDASFLVFRSADLLQPNRFSHLLNYVCGYEPLLVNRWANKERLSIHTTRHPAIRPL